MLFKLVFLLCMKYEFVFPYVHQKPIAKTMWPESCSPNERVLNDCNWCICDRGKFVCKARVCNEIDMFGHFNDPIQEHVVGMEGHGSWRSNGTVCTPRAHYRREGLLCVCDDDGNWPSPICRDFFRILHQVELTGHSRPSALHECTPHLLYLYGCNVCVCPPEGRINPDSCTRYNCSENDPILLPANEIKKNEDKYDLAEVYAECELQRKYIIGCRKCVCLKNNRLLCDNCESELSSRTGQEENYCEKEGVGQAFNIECNMCICDERAMMYCTARHCLETHPKPNVELSKTADMTLRTVDPPIDHMNCVIGTKYKKGCNTCFCDLNAEGKKTLSCTLKYCHKHKSARSSHTLEIIENDCVDHTVYEKNCLLCRCDVVDGVKRESCVMNSACSDEKSPAEKSTDLDSQRGYCEPSHVYTKGCNTCRCLSNGKVASCTARICRAQDQPLLVDVVPVRQRGSTPCPRDHMYKVDCNFCFCVSNGNILCTTANCDKQNK